MISPNGSVQWEEDGLFGVPLHSEPRPTTCSSRSQSLVYIPQEAASNRFPRSSPSSVQMAQQQGLMGFHSTSCSLPRARVSVDFQGAKQSHNRVLANRPLTPPHSTSFEAVPRYHLRPRRQNLGHSNVVSQTHHRSRPSLPSHSSNGDNDNWNSPQVKPRGFSCDEKPLRRSMRHRNASPKQSTKSSRKQR